ncbi:MAG: AAC(3) family N-acetyltransferase [Rhodospirillales bacterium]
MKTYSYSDILAAYKSVGVGPGEIVSVAGDMLKMAGFEDGGGRATVKAHFNALSELLGDTGTLVVSTASMYLCNTDVPFDIDETPSKSMGAISEHVRRHPDAVRSRHPFLSYAAIGPRAEEVIGKVSRHCYGPGTPEGRLADLNALKVSTGLPPHLSCSTVHHVEQIMGVPYRYIKEFTHPMKTGSRIVNELFYMHVWYRDIGVDRDKNVRLFERLQRRLEITEAGLGKGTIYAYRIGEFVTEACKIFADDIYVWCKSPPKKRPYTS